LAADSKWPDLHGDANVLAKGAAAAFDSASGRRHVEAAGCDPRGVLEGNLSDSTQSLIRREASLDRNTLV